MKTRRFGETLICRLERGEEIHEALKEIALKEHIQLGEVRALGATDDLTVGCYDVATKTYHKNHFTQPMEITMLYGNLSTMNGDYYAHLHVTAADEAGHVVGGHLNEARISATCEMFITVLEGTVDRFFDEETGLNLFQLDDAEHEA